MCELEVRPVGMADFKVTEQTFPIRTKSSQGGWCSLRDRPADHDNVPLAVAGMAVMAHMHIAPDGPHCCDSQLRLVERKTDGRPRRWVRRMVSERYWTTFVSSGDGWPQAISESDPELGPVPVRSRLECLTALIVAIVPCSEEFG